MLKSLFILTALFALLFFGGELMHRQVGWRAENSRKFVHALVGLLSMSFPLLFDKLWPVALLCGSFLLILLLSLRFDWLPSINKVKRKTVGSVLFPIVVALCFWLHLEQQNKLYFYLPILIMAVCDPLAATAGNASEVDKKSFRGLFAFFLGAFVLSVLSFSVQADWSLGLLLVASFALALTTAAAEFFSRKGWDNLSIPAVAVAVLLLIENSGL